MTASAGMAILALVSTGRAENPGMQEAVSQPKPATVLAGIASWACQYQNVNPAQIAASALDLVVIDPVLDGGSQRAAGPADIRLMQRKPDGGRRLVLAYLSVGAAEEYRAYWKPEWREWPPEWLGLEDPNWPRSYPVRFWHPQWQSIVNSALARIIEAGFDGIFLDRVDAYEQYRNDRPKSTSDMVDFVIDLASRARSVRPSFLVIGQNAEPLLNLEQYRNAIDAVSKESLLYGLEAEGKSNRPEEVAWSLHYLSMAKRAGLPILAIEYLKAPTEIAVARRRLHDLGFVPFFANRLLDRL